MRHRRSIGEYLAFLSVKYEVNPEKFLAALRSAEEHKKSLCGKLSIQYRGKKRSKSIFLVKRNSEVLAQFAVDEDFLFNRSNQLCNFMETEKIHRYLSKKDQIATARFIKDLRSGMQHITLKARILEVEEPKSVVTRHGNSARVAKALLADETGTIKICLWNGQIASALAGDTVQIENAQVTSFRGEKLVNLGRKGTLSNTE